jgi:predicted RNA-binding Zn ribbon-like protein
MTATRPPPFFIAGHPGLDFLNTLAVPVDEEVEWLTSGRDLLAWLKQTELVPASVLNDLGKTASPSELDAVAAQARALREWFRAFIHKHKGRRLPPTALRQLQPLNQVLARDEAFGQIVVRGQKGQQMPGLVWRPLRRWHSPESLLLPIARSLADLVCSEDFSNIKACVGPMCTLVFVDRTRGRRRKWCSMAVCGNRAKQSALRKRMRKKKI